MGVRPEHLHLSAGGPYEAAAEFLANTSRPIAEIAEQVGYSNQGKFAAVFKKQFGMSPLEYRRATEAGHTLGAASHKISTDP